MFCGKYCGKYCEKLLLCNKCCGIISEIIKNARLECG